jgi:hypothetical protein
MTPKFSVVTTFHAKGYHDYGSRMINTFLVNWPRDIDLYVYDEDGVVNQRHDRLHVIDFHDQVPALVDFKQRWNNDPRARGLVATGPMDRKGKAPGLGFRWDAIRFSHKVYAVCDHARRAADIMFWMDADMVCHSPISLEFVAAQIPLDVGLAFLGREKKFSECGLYAVNMRQPATRSFIEQFQGAYDDGSIFNMAEWNDCWVFDRIRERVQQQDHTWRQLDWCAGMIKGEGHPLINTAWGAYLDHLKGRRKDLGRSQTKDLLIPRSESYWSVT